MKKFLLTIITLAVTALVHASDAPDWREDGHTGACAWAKTAPGKSMHSLPMSIYTQPNATSSAVVLNNDQRYYWAVEKRGPWVKLKLSQPNGPFLNGPFVGWVQESQIEMGAFRNCS